MKKKIIYRGRGIRIERGRTKSRNESFLIHVVRYKKFAFRYKTIDNHFMAVYNTDALIARKEKRCSAVRLQQECELSDLIIPPYDGRWVRTPPILYRRSYFFRIRFSAAGSSRLTVSNFPL